MNTVTKASLESKIRRLEMFEQSQDGQLRLSLNEEYQLAAYRMLLDHMRNSEVLINENADLWNRLSACLQREARRK